MQKKFFTILLLSAIMISSSACEQNSPIDKEINQSTVGINAEEKSETPQTIEDELSPTLTEKDKENIPIEMARNNVDFGLYQIRDGWLYGAVPNPTNGHFYFAKRRLEDSEWKKLNGCYIYDFDFRNEFIYAVLAEKGNKTPIYRMNLSGNNTRKLVDGNTDILQVKGNKLYFCLYDNNNIPYFTSCDLDGSNVQRVLNKEVYYPYTPDGNLMFYQDDKDQEMIHKYNISTGEDVRVSSPYAYVPIYDGKHTLYYVRGQVSINTGKYFGDLVKRNLDTGEEIVLYSGAYTGNLLLAEDYLYFSNMNDEQRLYAVDINGENMKLIADDSYTTRYIYTGNKLIYYVMEINDGEQYIKDVYCSELDGSNRVSLLA